MRALAQKGSFENHSKRTKIVSHLSASQPKRPSLFSRNISILVQPKRICPCDGGCLRCAPVIQPKLIIGQPNDKYEQEADRVADEVMRIPEPEVQPKTTLLLSQGPSCGDEDMEGELIQARPIAERITSLVQRQPEEEEEPVEELEEEEEPIMTKALSNRTQQANDSLHIQLNRSRGGGQPLPDTDRDFMETRFGVDFSSVRVHTDSNAAQISRELNAQAFTHGRDIYFSAERYNPGTSSGKRLLAHELTHVIQQIKSIPMLAYQISPFVQRQAAGSCRGWERDPESFSIVVAEYYLRTEYGVSTHALNVQRNPRVPSCRCNVIFPQNITVEVDWCIRNLPGMVSTVSARKTHPPPGVICEYAYTCTTSGDINLVRRVCF